MTFGDMKKKYSLPEWQIINDNFDVGKLEETDDILRQIVKRMTEKIEFYAKFTEDLVQPEAFHSLQEADMVQNKKQMFDLYRKLMAYHRSCLEADLLGQKEQAELITSLTKVWPQHREELLQIMKSLKTGWQKHIAQDDAERYFG